MYSQMKTVILFCLFSVCVNFGFGEIEINERDSDIEEDFSLNNAINGTLYKTVKRYFCSVRSSNESELLVFGAREWSFPAQDVTLHLDYPSKNNSSSIRYLLTEVLVIVQLEGSRSEGFITSGGMMRDHISMKFLFSDITRLSYQFYLYGFPIQLLNNTENYNSMYDIC